MIGHFSIAPLLVLCKVARCDSLQAVLCLYKSCMLASLRSLLAKDALLCLGAHTEKRRDRGEADGVVERARDFLVNLLISHRRHKPAGWDDDNVSAQVAFFCMMHEMHNGPNPSR